MQNEDVKKDQTLLLGETQLCLVCDNVKPLEQGEAIVRFGAYIEFTCYQCKDKKTTTYDLSVRFTTDRELTEDEKGTLQHQVIAQIEEPVTAEGDDVSYSVTFYGSDIDEVMN